MPSGLGPGHHELSRAIITPVLRGSGMTWHREMLLSGVTHPAQSPRPEIYVASSKCYSIEDELSDCGRGPAATTFFEVEADSNESAIGLPVSSANESIVTQHDEAAGPRRSIVTRTDRRRRGMRLAGIPTTIARPAPE
jgi:hypothetical protein